MVPGRGALRRELTACVRTGRALRVPRARTRTRGKGFISDEVLIRERPAEADDRAVLGHWEGDLIVGLDSSAIGTLVERTTRFTMLLHLPRMAEHGTPRRNNGPARPTPASTPASRSTSAPTTRRPSSCRTVPFGGPREYIGHAHAKKVCNRSPTRSHDIETPSPSD